MQRAKLLAFYVLLATFLLNNEMPAQNNKRRPAQPNKPPTVLETRPQTITQQIRPVTVKVKNTQPIKGIFIIADNEAVKVDIGNGRQISIKLDEVISISFSDEAAPKESDVALVKEAEAAKVALKALRGLSAATEVGINYRDYDSRLIDTKITVKESLSNVSNNKLKDEIEAAMSDFTFALTVWSDFINSVDNRGLWRTDKNFIFSGNPIYSTIVSKYPDIPKQDLLGDKVLYKSFVFNAIWNSAGKHIEQATTLLESQNKQ